MANTIILCDNLVKIYKVADLEVVALQGLDLDVKQGEMLSLVGASGSGKSTLLNILGGLDVPSAGSCQVAGFDLTKLNEGQRLTFRRQIVGHVWQQSGRNLIPDFTVIDNIKLPQIADGVAPNIRTRRAKELLRLVGLADKAHTFPTQLSGGEQQRAGIAVALANAPQILLADEPTGELDSATAAQVLRILRALNQQLGVTVILVTHDPAIAGAMDRVIAIRDGRTSTETVRRAQPGAVAQGEVAASAVIGLSSATHAEAIIIDKVGRLQLPREFLESLPFNGKAVVRHAGDHVEIWPVQERMAR